MEAPSGEEVELEIESSNAMACTPEYTFEQLCCVDYPNIHTLMTRQGAMTLAAAQHTDDDGHVLMQNDATTAQTPILLLCTGSPVGATAAAAGQGAAVLPTECLDREFTFDEINGANGVPPGEAVLDARIEHLMQQQLPPSAIPVCVEAVQACPSGAGPWSASPDYLAQREAAMSALNATSPAVFLKKRAAKAARPARGPAVRLSDLHLGEPAKGRARRAALMQKTSGAHGGERAAHTEGNALKTSGGFQVVKSQVTFSGALMTSGSFTMMAAGGGF